MLARGSSALPLNWLGRSCLTSQCSLTALSLCRECGSYRLRLRLACFFSALVWPSQIPPVDDRDGSVWRAFFFSPGLVVRCFRFFGMVVLPLAGVSGFCGSPSAHGARGIL